MTETALWTDDVTASQVAADFLRERNVYAVADRGTLWVLNGDADMARRMIAEHFPNWS